MARKKAGRKGGARGNFGVAPTGAHMGTGNFGATAKRGKKGRKKAGRY